MPSHITISLHREHLRPRRGERLSQDFIQPPQKQLRARKPRLRRPKQSLKKRIPIGKSLKPRIEKSLISRFVKFANILIYCADYMVCRTSTSAPSPIFAIYKIGPSAILPTPATLPSPDLPKISWNRLTTLTALSKQSRQIRSARMTAIKISRTFMTG